MKKVLLKIDGMTCSACSTGLEKYLNKQEGVKATVNLVMNNASIEYDEKKYTIQDLEKFVAKAGFESLGIDKLEKEEKNKSKERFKLIGITVISTLILYISMAHMIKLPVIPFLSMNENPINYAISLWILATIVIYMGKDLIKNGIKNLIHKTPNMDTLVTLGVTSSYFYSLYQTMLILQGQTNLVKTLYFESSAIVIFFIKIGKYIENINKDKTKEAITELMTITPQNAIIEKNGKEITVTIDEIQKGDIVICKPGEKIAVDGTVIDGMTHINEAFITGESIPEKKEKGSKVVAGSINYEGTIKYKAEKIGKESTVSEIVRLVVEATNTKAPIAKIADKISGYFVPIVICIAIISLFVWIAIGTILGNNHILNNEVQNNTFSTAINVFVSILVVACPCSLGLATPLAIVISSGVASKKGILIKTSEALENAHKAKTIVFDKTGTLTNGNLTVSKIYNYSESSDYLILKNVAKIENKSEHPIARAIVNYVEGQNREKIDNNIIEKNKENIDKIIDKKAKDNQDENKVIDFKAIPGSGVSANLGDSHYLIGNKKLMQEKNIKIDKKMEKDEENLANSGNSILFITKNSEIIALIGVKDTLKPNAKQVIQKLKNNNIKVVMLTGDNEKIAKYIANELEIDEVIANVKPKEKAEKIKELKKDGLVIMCGDGINDSVSLVTANIGVSISSGTDIAIDSSSVILMNDNLDRINDLIAISKKTIRNIKQNLFWAFFYNICMIPIAMGLFLNWKITLNPMMAALAMTLSSLTVVFNALRLKKN